MSYGKDCLVVGDTVTLKGGSPIMTITHTKRYVQPNGIVTDQLRYTVNWVDTIGAPQELTDLLEASLVKATPMCWYYK